MDKLMKISAVIGSIFSVVSIILICYVGSHKVVIVSDDEIYEQTEVQQKSSESQRHQIGVADEDTNQSAIYIPMESNVSAEGITIQTVKMYQGLEIIFEKASGKYYDTNDITGAVSAIQDAFYVENSGSIEIFLDFNKVYECDSHVTGNLLQINLEEPRDVYDKIIIVDDRIDEDSAGEEKSVAIGIGEQVKEKLEAAGIKTFETGSFAEQVDDQSVISMANKMPADFYIRVVMEEKMPNHTENGILTEYNSTFFMPQLNNVQFADILEREVTVAVDGTADGLKEADEESILQKMEIPSATIYVGDFNNAKEGLSQQSTYQGMVAEGISKAVQDAYDVMETK